MCALVCRAWVLSTRYHLFGDVEIRVSTYNQITGRFSALIGHLDHPLCTFAPSVRKLFISTSTKVSGPMPLYLPPNWADPLIPYLPKLISVTTLFAHEIGRPLYGWKPLFNSTPFVTQITHLSLNSPEFVTFEDCMATVHSFPSLEILEYIPHSLYDQGTLPSLPAFSGSPPPSLRTLHVESFSPNTQLIWQWFHRSQTRLSVIKLGGLPLISTHDISAAKLSFFAQYLQFLGPSLEELHAGFQAAPTLCEFPVDRTLECIN